MLEMDFTGATSSGWTSISGGGLKGGAPLRTKSIIPLIEELW